MNKTSDDELTDVLTRLILGGATDVRIELLAGDFIVLRWKFPNGLGGILPLEMEEACHYSCCSGS